MNISVGENQVLSSGTVLSIDDLPVIFELSPTMHVWLHFKITPMSIPHEVTFKLSDDGVRLNVTVAYPVNEAEIGTNRLIHVGDIESRELYFLFHLKEVSDTSKLRVLHYTWLQGKFVK
jgi:hypothetical protein